MARSGSTTRNLLTLGALVAAATIPGSDADCLIGDIMYAEGDPTGHIGLECVNSTSYEGLASSCGPDGTVVEEERIFKCPEESGVPFCVQCGPRGRGAALCLSTPTTDRDCGEGGGDDMNDGTMDDGEDFGPDYGLGPDGEIICPDGRDPIADTFCGRGPNRADCAEDEFCFIHPADRFAVCCPGSLDDGGGGGGGDADEGDAAAADDADADDEYDGKLPDVVLAERERCGTIFDMHLHLAPWFSDADGLLAELDASGVDGGVLLAVYAPFRFPGQRDPNEEISDIALGSGGRILGLASCNTTHPTWEEDETVREGELGRLRTYLSRAEFVGVKLAPPHTCLRLDGGRMEDVVRTVAQSSRARVLGVHVGTTPFCGPMGAAMGLKACCSRPYVDPTFLVDLIGRYPEVTFILLHSGSDFLPPDDANYYNGTLVDVAINVTKAHPNVYLEVSAMHGQNTDGTLRYPGADAKLRAMVDAGVADRVIWASDANFYEGNLLTVLTTAIKALIDAGFTEEQRCMALGGTPRRVLGLDDDGPPAEEAPPDEAPTPAPSPTTTSRAGSRFATLLSDREMPIQVIPQTVLLAIFAAACAMYV